MRAVLPCQGARPNHSAPHPELLELRRKRNLSPSFLSPPFSLPLSYLPLRFSFVLMEPTAGPRSCYRWQPPLCLAHSLHHEAGLNCHLHDGSVMLCNHRLARYLAWCPGEAVLSREREGERERERERETPSFHTLPEGLRRR